MGLTPEIDIATHIDNTVGALTLGTDLRHSPVAPPDDLIPAKCVFVYPTGGPAPFDFCGEARAERRSRISIRTRGDRDDYTNTLALARTVRDAVHRSETTLTNYIHISALETEPIPLGLDDQGLPEYSQNFEAFFTE